MPPRNHTKCNNEIAALDLRRQSQIANQVATINRLLDDPDAATEIARLQARIAELEVPGV